MWESIVDRLEANENDIVRIAVTGVAGDATVIVIVVINYVVVCVQQRTVIVVTIFKFGAYIFLLIRAIVHISFRTNGHILQGAEFLVAMICDNIRSVVRIIRGAVPRIGDALTKSNILVDSINIIKGYVDTDAGNRQAAYGAIINGSLGTVRIRMVLAAAIVAERGGGDLGDRLRLSALLNFVLDYVLRQIAGVIIQSGDLLGEYRGAGSGLGRVDSGDLSWDYNRSCFCDINSRGQIFSRNQHRNCKSEDEHQRNQERTDGVDLFHDSVPFIF